MTILSRITDVLCHAFEGRWLPGKRCETCTRYEMPNFYGEKQGRCGLCGVPVQASFLCDGWERP